jgi:hypothetical protein
MRSVFMLLMAPLLLQAAVASAQEESPELTPALHFRIPFGGPPGAAGGARLDLDLAYAARDGGLLAPPLLNWRFTASDSRLAVGGMPIAATQWARTHDEAEDRAPPERGSKAPAIVAAAGASVALIVLVAGEAFDEMFDDWDPDVTVGGDSSGDGGDGGGDQGSVCVAGVCPGG